MTLAAGSKLGPYEILGQIGAGGMGEVYRARDPRLSREVAIKVLPATFSADADRLRRFEQEAKAAGVLNHPNITAVYDIGSHDGAPYVVQELLEGETLRAELAAGRLPQRRSIDDAIQIAHGLAAAHEKGIVHRDLKPENLFITKDGRVKILDFGLAKLTQAEGTGSSATNLPTETRGTEPGVVLGTLGYMSPEQVRGKPADARSDIFSFGAILYEMLSGNRAFRGDSAADTMSAILREDPPDLSVTNQHISPSLERIVRHCLEKNPERRFQSASDIAFDLEMLSGSSGAVPASAGAARRSGRLLWPAIALLALLLGLGAGTLWMSRSRAPAPPRFQQLTYRRGQIDNARFAPDGQTVVFSASWDGGPMRLYTLRPGSPEWSALSLPSVGLLAVSRPGELAVAVPVGDFPSGSWTLARAPLAGGSPRDVLADVDEADWAPDGASLAVTHKVNGKTRLEYPIGKVLYESSDRVESPRFSPRGDQIAFVDHPVQRETLGSVMLADLSGSAKPLSEDWFDVGSLAWSPNAREIWFSASRTGSRQSLWAVTLSGRLRRLAETPGSSAILDVSPAGNVLLSHGSWRAFLSGVPPGESVERDFSWLDFTFLTDLSEDGRTLLFQEWGDGGGTAGSVYLRRMDGSPPLRLGEGFGLSLSPDGQWVVARLYTQPPRLVLLPTGAGEARPLSTEGILVQHAAWFPDGKRILLLGSAPDRKLSYYSLDVAGGPARPIAPATGPGWLRRSLISPDGRALPRLDADGRLSLLPLDGGESRPVAGIEPGEVPVRWTADGRFLFVVKIDGARRTISRVDPLTGRREVWKEFLLSADPVGLNTVATPLLLSADGKSYFWSYQRRSDELYLVEGLK